MQKRPSNYFHFLSFGRFKQSVLATRTNRKRGSNRNRRSQWAAFVMQIAWFSLKKFTFITLYGLAVAKQCFRFKAIEN